jgi:putative MATE family efflux protein
VEKDEQGKGKEFMTAREREMGTAKIPGMVLRYSIPTIIGMLVSAMYVVVDRFFVARIEGVGADALAGVTLASPVMLILQAFSLLIGVGSAANISIRLGKGDRAGAEKILGNAFILILIVSITMGTLALIFLEPLLMIFGADENTLPFAYIYTQIKIFGIVLMFLSFAMNHPIRAAGNAKRFASAQLLGAILNIFLNPLFIFTFDMGIHGAGWSTVVAQAASAAWVMSYYFRGQPAIRLRRRNFRLDPKYIVAICSIGVAPFFMQLLSSAIQGIANNFLGYLGGGHAIGAYGAIIAVFSLFVMPIFGITQGSQPILGFNYGAGNMKRVRTAYFWSALYAVSICVLGMILMVSLPTQIVGLFAAEPEIIEIGAVGIRIMAITLPAAAFVMNASTFFMSIGRAKISILLSVMRQGIVLIPLYFILPQFFGIFGIWWATPAADLTAFTVAMLMILREMRRLRKHEIEC